jgi:hypothetical protein
MMQVSRRNLLLFAGTAIAGTAMAGIAMVGGAGAKMYPAETMIRAVIRKRFPNVQISEDDLRSFSRDYIAYKVSPDDRWLLRVAGMAPDLSLNAGLRQRLPGRARKNLDAFENSVTNMFLLSTDFFRRSPEDRHAISYVAYADPLVNPCMNPLARFEA